MTGPFGVYWVAVILLLVNLFMQIKSGGEDDWKLSYALALFYALEATIFSKV